MHALGMHVATLYELYSAWVPFENAVIRKTRGFEIAFFRFGRRLWQHSIVFFFRSRQ